MRMDEAVNGLMVKAVYETKNKDTGVVVAMKEIIWMFAHDQKLGVHVSAVRVNEWHIKTKKWEMKDYVDRPFVKEFPIPNAKWAEAMRLLDAKLAGE